MHRTAGTLVGVAGELNVGARLLSDAATVMPPAAAADAAATIARVEGRLVSVGARYVQQSADLTRRAIFAELDESAVGLLVHHQGKHAVHFLFDLRNASRKRWTNRRYFTNGRFNPGKWLFGGHRWGYRNGFKSQLRRDWQNLRGIARMSRSSWNSFASDVKHEAGAVKRAVVKEYKADLRLTRGIQRAVGHFPGGRVAFRLAKGVLKKVAIPVTLYESYKKSSAISPVGKLTSALLSTAVGFVPVVALADIVTDGGATGAVDTLVSGGESLTTHDASSDHAIQAVRDGKQGWLWKSYYGFFAGE
jgi:hypothetical protein